MCLQALGAPVPALHKDESNELTLLGGFSLGKMFEPHRLTPNWWHCCCLCALMLKAVLICFATSDLPGMFRNTLCFSGNMGGPGVKTIHHLSNTFYAFLLKFISFM